ncbi:MAG TPA: MFS transporter, partial [Polyangiaceae bacterium]|nr:MFS transporter [Polyangiaceae bacterium]
LATLGLLTVGLFAWVEHRASDPIIPGYFIREKTLAVLGNLVTGAVMYSFIFFLPLFLRAVLRASPGTGLIPLTFSLVAGSILGGRLITRYGTRTTSMLAAGVLVFGALAATQLKASTPLFALAIIGPCIGIGVGGLLVSMVITMQAGTPAAYMGVSSSLSQFMRNLGGLLSVNLLSAMQAAVFRSGLPLELRSTLTQAGGAKGLAESLFSGAAEGGAQVIAAYTRASTTVFWACALLGGVALLISFRLPRVRLESEAHQEAEAH